MHTNIHGFIRELSGPRPLCRAVDSLKAAYDLESHHSGVPLGNQPTVRTVAGEWERLLSVRLNLYRGRHPLADTTFDAQNSAGPTCWDAHRKIEESPAILSDIVFSTTC